MHNICMLIKNNKSGHFLCFKVINAFFFKGIFRLFFFFCHQVPGPNDNSSRYFLYDFRIIPIREKASNFKTSNVIEITLIIRLTENIEIFS